MHSTCQIWGQICCEIPPSGLKYENVIPGVSVAGPLCNDCIYTAWLGSAPFHGVGPLPELWAPVGWLVFSVLSLSARCYRFNIISTEALLIEGFWSDSRWEPLRGTSVGEKKKPNKKTKIKSVRMRSALSGLNRARTFQWGGRIMGSFQVERSGNVVNGS